MIRNILVLILVLATACAFSQTAPSTAPDPTCPAKLAEWKGWAETNIPIYNQTLAENADLKAELHSRKTDNETAIMVGMGIVLGVCIVIGVYRKHLAPKTLRGKQAAILLGTALWTSASFLVQTRDSGLTYHPLGTFVVGLLYASPALLFGAIGFWWFWPWNRNGKVERLWQAD